MRSRRKAREAVLQALYQADSNNEYSAESFSLFFEVFYSPRSTSLDDPSEESSTETRGEESLEFARILLELVIKNLALIDSTITGSSTHWTLARMNRVDRNLLRLATGEILFLPDVPSNVSINEAIELAKRFGNEESPKFVNGVLDKIAKQVAVTAHAAPEDKKAVNE